MDKFTPERQVVIDIEHVFETPVGRPISVDCWQHICDGCTWTAENAHLGGVHRWIPVQPDGCQYCNRIRLYNEIFQACTMCSKELPSENYTKSWLYLVFVIILSIGITFSLRLRILYLELFGDLEIFYCFFVNVMNIGAFHLLENNPLSRLRSLIQKKHVVFLCSAYYISTALCIWWLSNV